MDDIAKTHYRRRLVVAVQILIALPLLGVLMGAVYSLPAMQLTKERDPGLSLLLSMGLGMTVFGIGCFCHVPLAYLTGVWALSLVLLVCARWFYGSLGHSLERFGIVHAMTLLTTIMVCGAVYIRKRAPLY